MQDEKILYKDLSYKIVGILFEVYNEIGYGYREKYYENGVAAYFDKKGLNYTKQARYKIRVKDIIIGVNYIDFIVENKIVLEIKKGNYFSKQNLEQVKQYLQITGFKLAILANFTSNGVKYIRVLSPNNLQNAN